MLYSVVVWILLLDFLVGFVYLFFYYIRFGIIIISGLLDLVMIFDFLFVLYKVKLYKGS